MEKRTFVSVILKPDVVLAMCLALVLNSADHLDSTAFSHVNSNETNIELVDFKYNYDIDSERQERRKQGENLIFFDSRSSGNYEPSWYYQSKSIDIKSLTELVWLEYQEKVTDTFLKESLDKFVAFVNNFNSWPDLSRKDLQYQTIVNHFVLGQSAAHNDYRIHTNVDLGPSYLPKFISDRITDINNIYDFRKKEIAVKNLIKNVSQQIHTWLKNEKKVLYIKEKIQTSSLTDLVDLVVIEDSIVDGRDLKYITNKIYQEKKIIGKGFILISTYDDSVGKFSNQLNININIENAVASINVNDLQTYLMGIYNIPRYSYKNRKKGYFVSIADAAIYDGLVNKISEFIKANFQSNINSSEELVSVKTFDLIEKLLQGSESISSKKIKLINKIISTDLSSSEIKELRIQIAQVKENHFLKQQVKSVVV